MNVKTARSGWVDYAKGIGILLVVLGHVARGVNSAEITLGDWFWKIDSILYSFHMPLFFFLAGLCFYPSFAKRGAFGVISSKFDTIVYPYILWSLIQGGIMLLMSRYTSQPLFAGDVFSLWMPQFQFWFLHVLFVVFVIVVCLFKLLPRPIVLVLLGASALLYLGQFLLPMNYVSMFIANYLVFFAAGVLVCLWREKIKAMFNPIIMLPLFLLLFVESQYSFHYVAGMDYMMKGVLTLLLALLSIATVVALSLWLDVVAYCRWIAYLGVQSMPIFLMHILAGSGVRIILQHVLGIDSVVIHLVVGVAAGILLPLWVVRLTQRWSIQYLWSLPISQYLLKLKPKASI